MKAPRLSPIVWMGLLCGLGAAGIAIVLVSAAKPWNVDLKPGKPPRIHDFVVIYEWWAAAINLTLLILLGLAARWWLKPARRAADPWLPERSTPRWFWPLVLAAMALAAFWGIQRISQSLWDDEESSLHRAVLGQYRRDSSGELKLRETTWEIALWNYWKPSNHQLQTILSKACLEGWQAIARPVGLQFSETVVRLPCLAAGVLSVASLALLLKRLGFARAGVIAAFLLSVHPWHVRYVVELRGYIFTLLFGPLMIYCLVQAIDSGRWRWWAGFAASEFALLYAYPGCLYMVAIANFCGAVALFLRHSTWDARSRHLPRLLVASTVAGMIYLQLMLPCLPQLINYFKTERALGEIGLRWHKNMGAHLLAGIPWNNSDVPSAGYQELQWAADAHPHLFVFLRSAALVCLLLGALRLGLSHPAGWIALAVLLLPGPLVYIVSRSKNHYLYEWYLLFALSGLVAFVALGVDWLTALAGRAHRFAPPLLGGSAVFVFFIATQPQRHWLVTHSLQPMREAVLVTRPSLDPADPRQKAITTLSVTGVPWSYDPNIIVISSVDQLAQYLREADRESKTLYVNFANAWTAAATRPALFALIEDDRLFEKTAHIQGFDPTLTTFVRKYKPGSISGYPLCQ
ncbi:MAG TPA: glycosyltransferase family 39 protein [Terrimicrobiaceae bacterium]